MSQEADFGLSDWVGQAGGTQLSWEIAWDGVYDDWRFGAVSFQSDFGDSELVRVSESFISAGTTTHFPPRSIVAFRFAVIVIPNQ